MRLALALALALVIATSSSAQEAGGSAKQPTDKEVLDMCGARLKKVFAKFGTPVDLIVSDDNDGGVNLDYGTFGFKIKAKTATTCFFWPEWTGSVKGIKIGDTKEQVLKALGKNTKTFNRPDGQEDYGWAVTDPEDTVFWTYFDKDGKVRKMDVELN
jgi:hypothetical protein